MFREVRRRLGKVRDQLLYGERDRRLLARAQALRVEWIDSAVDALPPLQSQDTGPQAEIHMMCGDQQAAMGFWSSYSICRYMPDVRFVIHSDGSLSPTTIERWRRIIPWLEVRDRETTLSEMECRLRDFPRVLEWSVRYHFGLKLGGYCAAARSKYVLDIDTDTLTFLRPDSILDAIEAPGRSMRWNADERTCYAYSESILREALGPLIGTHLPQRLNGGYLLAPVPTDEEWSVLDKVLDTFVRHPNIDPFRYWMHQTLWAIFASHLPLDKTSALPKDYDIHSGMTRALSCARHYVGSPGIRPRFFTEGVPRIFEQLSDR